MPTEKSQVQQGSATTKQSNAAAGFDRDLDDLPADLRWRAWMQRVEAVIFASAAPVPREDLAQVVGQDAHIDLLIGDIQSELQSRPYELLATSNGWMFRTRPEYSDAIRMAADVGQQVLDLSEAEIAVLAAIALHQPLSRSGLKDIFGK